MDTGCRCVEVEDQRQADVTLSDTISDVLRVLAANRRKCELALL